MVDVDELREDVYKWANWLYDRWCNKRSGALGVAINQGLFLVKEHSRFWGVIDDMPNCTSREIHLLYSLRNLLELLSILLEGDL